jgi:hypothetical protein
MRKGNADSTENSNTDSKKVDNFVCKTIAALFTGTVLFLASPLCTFGQTITWTTSDTDASVDISNGNVSGLNPSGTSSPTTVVIGNNLAFGNAGHTLTINDNGPAGTAVTSLNAITTVTNGGGTLIFDSGSNLIVDTNIGTSSSRRITTVDVRNNSGGNLTVTGTIYAGTLTVDSGATLKAGAINAVTLGGGGTGTSIETNRLTVNSGVFAGNITSGTGNFTANVSGNFTISQGGIRSQSAVMQTLPAADVSI